MEFSFTRYLAAKQTVDDRSLNYAVWQTLAAALPSGPIEVLEVGAGTGSMIDRLDARGLIPAGGHYTAIDGDPDNIAAARERRATASVPFAVELETADVYAFARREHGRRLWDVVIAHAFLDLMDVPRLLPELFALLRPGGLFYFPINFDGLTILEPPIDPIFDSQVTELYHRTMDERRIDGRRTGGSRAGRTLLSQIPAAGGKVMAAGASDWVVFPRDGVYAADEAYFLHYILHFFEDSLAGRPELDQQRFRSWMARRRKQIEDGELIFIAHQIDVCGRVSDR